MTNLVHIRGAGGKDGAGGGGISEDPDSLQSTATARVVDLISEGEIAGLVNGEFSIYLNDIPIRDLIGTPNYKTYGYNWRLGTQDQPPMNDFVGTESEESVGLKFTKTSGRLVRSITDASADTVRVTVAVQGLSVTDESGHIGETSVSYRVLTGRSGDELVERAVEVIKGKTNARFQKSVEYDLSVHGAGPYQVAVERITDDSDSNLLVNDTYWDSFTVVNYEKFTYPNSALIGIQVDARYFSAMPSRKYHVRGLLVRVPRNCVNSQGVYDRSYRTTGSGTTNGTWDGTFAIAWTDNPVWCYYDMVENTRYGAGKHLAGTLDKFQLYELAKYCDEHVPTGISADLFDVINGSGYTAGGNTSPPIPKYVGPTEPRFTLNCVINTHDKALKVLSNLSSVFRAMTFWGGSSLYLVQDAPAEPSMLYTNANVIDGQFTYQGTSRTARHTVAVVAWNDNTEGGRQKFEYIEDRAGVKRYGINRIDITAFGCTSRTQARRVGLWLLYTERYETDVISWRAGPDSAMVLPGEIVEIADRHKMGARWGGRVIGGTTTSVELDAGTQLSAGSYTLSVMMPSGQVVSRPVVINTAGTYQTLTFTNPLPSAPNSMAIWTLYDNDGVVTRRARVVSVIEQEDGLFEISATDHNPSKYNAIETGAQISDLDYSFLEYEAVPAVTGLTSAEYTYRLVRDGFPRVNMNISWDFISDPMVRGYVVKLSGANGTIITYPETKLSSFTAEGIEPTTYTISVWAVNHFGITGRVATRTQVITGIDSRRPADVTNFRSVLTNQGYQLFWDEIADYIDYYEIREGTVWASGTNKVQVKSNTHTLGAFTGSYKDLMIKAVDTSLNESLTESKLRVTRGAITMSPVASSFQNGNAVLEWNPADSQLAIRGYKVRYGTSWETGVPALGNLETEVQATSVAIPITWSGDRRFMVRAVDVAGNESTESALVVSVGKPGICTNRAFSFVDSDVLLTWDAPAGPLPIREYRVRYGTSYAAGTAAGTTASPRLAVPGNWGTASARTFWVVAVDSNGNEGTPASLSVTIPRPAAPGVTSSIEGTTYQLTWTTPTNGLRVDEFRLLYGSTLAGATPIGTIKGTSYSGLVTWTGARKFYVQAVDSGGNVGVEGTTTITIDKASAPTVTCAVTKDHQASVRWTQSVSSLPVQRYRVTWVVNGALKTSEVVGLEMVTAIDWTGSMTFTVVAIDSANTAGLPGTGTLVIVPPSQVVVAAPVVDGTGFVLTWTAQEGSLPISTFEVRYGTDFAAGTMVTRADTNSIRVEGAWLGDRVFHVAAIDRAGNVGAAGSRTVTIVAPGTPAVTQQVIDNNVLLKWSATPGTLPIKEYKVLRGNQTSTEETAAVIGTLSGQFTVVFEAASGYYNYFVVAYDTAGNRSTLSGMVTAYVNQPPDYVLQLDRNSDFNGVNYEFSANGNTEGFTVSGATVQVIDGEAVLTSNGTTPLLIRTATDMFFYGCEHPRVRMKLRRIAGSGWRGRFMYITDAHAAYSTTYREDIATDPTSIGNTVIIEWDLNTLTAGGTDWMTSRINGFRFQLGLTATDVFAVDWIRFVSFNSSNVHLTEENRLQLPVNVGETYAAHFTSRTWTGPSAQVAANYPRLIQPTPNTAYYEEIVDYGAVLAASQIQVTPTIQNQIGSVTITPKISTKKLPTDAWTDYNGVYAAYGTDFRYTKVRLDVTAPDDKSLVQLNNLNIKLSVKKKSDSGKVQALSTDVGGTVVNFNTTFIDVESIQVTLYGTTPGYAIADFSDVPNPTSFKVLAFDTSGARISATVGWTAAGV